MNAPDDPRPEDADDELDDGLDDRDPLLEAAGARLRADAHPLSADRIQVAVLRRRSRRLTAGLVAAALVVAVGAGAVVLRNSDDGDGSGDLASNVRPKSPAQREGVEQLVASLANKQPVDPTKVQLRSTVSTFANCDALIGDLRTVGAEHVGSQGFGGYGGYALLGGGDRLYSRSSYAADGAVATSAGNARSAPMMTPYNPTVPTDGGDTVGTNVQVVGVDELDGVKAAGKFIFDLDGKGNLRITDANTLEVRSTLDVTPRPIGAPAEDEEGEPRPEPTNVSQLVVSGNRVVIFGSETEISKPVKGDPSATRASTGYLTVTFVDTTDVFKPKITDRVRVEGGLVSARLVNGEVRLVTTSNMADLGFVMPTTPTSVAKALEQNRRSVASSTAADWIPDWQRANESARPLVPCERVHVPDTFSGVAMTSMVTFPVAPGRFEPAGTAILAPGSTLYAGLDRVAISSEVWVDPIDRERLKFDDWKTAIHEFRFTEGEAPGYKGSGIVDGSTIGQFAFGEIGGSLAVVTTKGTPWAQKPKLGVDLTVLTPDGDGHLDVSSQIKDLSDGHGSVTAVRFVTDRVLISTGYFGRQVYVIDVTDPAAPRRAGHVNMPGDIGYFHPLPDGQALVVGSRSDTVGTGKNRRSRQWVQAHLLDVTNADAPKIVSTWERSWSADEVGYDHHAFTYWPARNLAMWGIQDTQGSSQRPNHAAVLGITDAVYEGGMPVANRPNEVPAPCPIVEAPAEALDMIGRNGHLLRCDDVNTKTVTWPRYECSKIGKQTLAGFVPEAQRDSKAFFACRLAPMPRVSRVLVVSGRPILFTDQTLEALDPTTFASTAIAYHPSSGGYYY